jgi:hypothetical protein
VPTLDKNNRLQGNVLDEAEYSSLTLTVNNQSLAITGKQMMVAAVTINEDGDYQVNAPGVEFKA